MDPEAKATLNQIATDVAWLRKTVEDLITGLNEVGSNPLLTMLFGKRLK